MIYPRVFSGVRPTGGIHLGNYLGAIRNWVDMQSSLKDGLFCIVDLHALTTLSQTNELRKDTLVMTAAYLAAGLDPNKCHIFAQSHVAAHSELAWVLGCMTPLGWLNRMTQFKDKAGKHKDKACLGLYAYPVLQAADVLAYNTTHVPVGEDQKQHLELARDIAGSFNNHYGQEFFTLPEPMILGDATRVMSLRDGTSKMSKSDISAYSRIEMMDDADTLALKVRKAKTDTEPLPAETKELEGRPEALNLITIYASLSEQKLDTAISNLAGKQFSEFKAMLTDVLVDKITPIGDEMRRLLGDEEYLLQVLRGGAEYAAGLSQQTMDKLAELIGFVEQ